MAQTQPQWPVPDPLPSCWIAETQPLDDFRSSDDLPSAADVVIIGSGFAGVATAYHLLNDNPDPPSIVLLEARKICSGATGRNGGHIKPDLFYTAAKHANMYGAAEAAEIAAFETANLYAVKDLVELEQIDCDFHLTRGLDVFLDPEHAKDTEETYRRLVESGVVNLRDVAFTPKDQAERISGVRGAQCCFSFTAGHLWPSKLIHTLLRRLVADKGLVLHANTPVSAVMSGPDNDAWAVCTPRGTISAGKVVHATNAYAGALLPEYAKSIVASRGICSHITTPAGRESPHLPNTYCIRFSPSTYDYLICRPDGSIVVGGAKQTFRHDPTQWYGNVHDDRLMDGASSAYFDGYMQRHFRGWEGSDATTTKVWTGIMGYSSDFVPHVGEVPGRPGQFIQGGFTGHGMPAIFLTSKAVADMVRGARFEETGLPSLYKTTRARNEVGETPLEADVKGSAR